MYKKQRCAILWKAPKLLDVFQLYCKKGEESGDGGNGWIKNSLLLE